MADSELFWDTKSTDKDTNAVFSILKCLGNDIDSNVDNIIEQLFSNLGMTETGDENDLYALRKMLQLKMKRRKTQAEKMDLCTVINQCLGLLNTSSENSHSIQHLCDILSFLLLLLDEQQLMDISQAIFSSCGRKLCCFVNEDSDRLHHTIVPYINLRILNAVLSALIHRNGTCNKALPAVETINMFLLDLMLCGVDQITAYITFYIIPKLLKYIGSSNLLPRIWQHLITKSVAGDMNDTSTLSFHAHCCVYQVLCALAEYFFPNKDNANTAFDMIIESEFWKILQQGLTHLDPLIRKQSLYLMKRAIVSAHQRNLCVDVFNPQSLFWWDSKTSKSLMKLWEEFFLIIETLEEKQTHIIKPVLPLIVKLVNSCSVPFACGYVLDKSWLYVIFQRVIAHDSVLIVKWGISHFVFTNSKLQISQNEHLILEFVMPLLNAVNNNALYFKSAENISPTEIREELSKLFESLATGNLKISSAFSSRLLTALESISWSPVPLFNVIYALSSISTVLVWNTKSLIQLKAFTLNALRTQHTFIRGAIQCLLLKCIIKLTDCSSINLETVIDVLGTFRDTESLKRGTSAWHDIAKWLNIWVSKDSATDFISKFILNLTKSEVYREDNLSQLSKRSIARITVLLCDSEIISIGAGSPINDALQHLGDCLHDCHARSYINEMAQNESLELLVCLLKEAQPVSGHIIQEDETGNIIINLISYLMEDIFVYIWKKMCTSTCMQEYYLIDMCMDTLETLRAEAALSFLIVSKIHELQSKSLYVATSEISSMPAIRKYFSMKILAWISCCLKNYEGQTHSQVWSKQKIFVENIIINNKLNHILVKEQGEERSTRDVQTLWGRVVSGYLESLWCVLADYLHTVRGAESNILNFTSVENIIMNAIDALEVGGRAVVIPVMKVLKKLLPHILAADDRNVTLSLISLCWSSTFELRKTALFWISMKLFVEMIFQHSIISSQLFRKTLMEYAGEIFTKGKTITGLCNLLIKQLQVLSFSAAEVLEDYCEILVDALTFGSVHRRDQRIHSDTCAFIESLGDECAVNILSTNDCSADNEVRARAIQLLFNLCASSTHQHLMENIMDILLQKEKTESGGKNRYFSNSHIHHLKHHVMQALLLLEPALTLEYEHSLLIWLKDGLIEEGSQPSVRYQREWLLVRILYHHPHLRHKVWDYFQEASKRRPGSLCSFMSIIYHLACVISDYNEQEMFLERGIREISPWCMAQQFTIRLYAQTVIQKIFLLCETKNLNAIAEKYSVLKWCIQSSMKQGSAVKNSLKLQEDFYFNGFHPIKHYSLETIFYELPRLANVAEEEYISVSQMKACGVTEMQIKMENSDSFLKNSNVAVWILRSTGEIGGIFGEKEDSAYSEAEISRNFQKKLVPWKSMVPDVELMLSSSDILWERKQRAAEEGIIVVASLIDKAPNLGGLCRTCEVFGASEYVIGNLRCTEDRQFQLLSVTAEQWITITEVKTHVLPKYLEEKKRVGYILIGAEQTANSTPLNEMKFSKKTVLLLGNEREGIPADLLPLLDRCVEIPQQGVVRSLNVHVTGALFLWEYSRQHILNSSSST